MDPQTFLIWFVGFYEGEGSVSNDKHNNNRIRLSVSQNDVTPLLLARERWGGKVYKRVRKSPASDKICTGHEWRLGHVASLRFIEVIRPYMLIPAKSKQIDVALKKASEGYKMNHRCNFCEKSYANAAGRRRHERKEHIAKGVLFKCELCDRTFKSKDSVNRHKRINHQNTDASPAPKGAGQETLQRRETPEAQTTTRVAETLHDRRGNDLAHRNNV